jgi:YesN/AraC family two-component response regulator
MVNGIRFPIKEGDVVYVQRGATHRFFVGENELKTLEVKFVTEDQTAVAMLSHINTLFKDKDHHLFDLFSRIVSEGQKKQLEYKTMCNALLLESLTEMTRLCAGNLVASSDTPTGVTTEQHTRVIQTVDEYVYRHLNKNFSLKDLAAGCGYNQDYIYRAIKKEFGISAIQYVNKIKFEQAKRLMQHTELSLSEIAWNLGFDSIQYFSKFFRQHARTSPSEYCDRMRRAIRIDY